jgi:hypothetical protein
MNPYERYLQAVTRRHFFKQLVGPAVGFGIGSTALASLLSDDIAAQVAPAMAPGGGGALGGVLHHAPKAKRVIYLSMCGGPSHLDMFDHKPMLEKLDGQKMPESILKGERFAQLEAGEVMVQKSPFRFKRYGESGMTISELLPGLATVVDDVSFIKSMYTTQFNHAPAQILHSTGFQIPGRPSFGSWLTYGIGSESKDLPGFVVLLSGSSQPDGGSACWSAGFLPTQHQGVQFQRRGDPINFVTNPPGVTAETRRRTVDGINELNAEHLEQIGDPETTTRIASYELAYKMQTSVPDLMDIASEPQAIHEMYGTTPGQTSFANNCLLARRLVERGVRFVELFHRGWDHHGTSFNTDIVNGMPLLCGQVDNPAAALIKDLKQRGLLDDTLVIFAGEFGRTPMLQGDASKSMGRDHHVKAYTIWMAGGGVAPGRIVGETDDFGFNSIQDPVSVHDLHATALHLLGIDHTRLTYKFQGRPFRLTDTEGHVVKKILA